MNGSEGKLRSEQSVCWFRAVKGALRNFIIPGEGPLRMFKSTYHKLIV